MCKNRVWGKDEGAEGFCWVLKRLEFVKSSRAGLLIMITKETGKKCV